MPSERAPATVVATSGGLVLDGADIGLTIERSTVRCEQTSIWRAGRACGAFVVIVRLTAAAEALYAEKTGNRWQDVQLCLDPKTCGLGNMAHLSGILELLR